MSCEGCSGAVTRVLKKLPGQCTRRRAMQPAIKRWRRGGCSWDPAPGPRPHPLFSLPPEVSDIQIDMEAQTVTVETTLDKDAILAQINKTGKACSFAQEE